jgi:dimeric dUTPase (all-alpha-NTP-PPase superfamily)
MSIDKLDMMMKMQKTLQEKAYGYSFEKYTHKERVAFIKEMSIHATQEIHEMLYELPFFKPWKNYDAMTEEEVQIAFDKAKGEFIDFIHFTLNMALALGMTGDEIAEGYYKKNNENYKRQEEGYTHDKSFRS